MCPAHTSETAAATARIWKTLTKLKTSPRCCFELRASSTRNCHSDEVCHRRAPRADGACASRRRGGAIGMAIGVASAGAGAGGAAAPAGVLTVSASTRSMSQSAGFVIGGSGAPGWGWGVAVRVGVRVWGWNEG